MLHSVIGTLEEDVEVWCWDHVHDLSTDAGQLAEGMDLLERQRRDKLPGVSGTIPPPLTGKDLEEREEFLREMKDLAEELASELNNAKDDLEGVEFPGMY